VAEGPHALVLSGEAGIGKTVLWDAGVEEARARFGDVLTCRGVEAEASLSFASLSDLLEGTLGDAALSVAPPRRRALEVALLLAEPGDQAPDGHAMGLAVLECCVASPGGACRSSRSTTSSGSIPSVLQVALRHPRPARAAPIRRKHRDHPPRRPPLPLPP
jgi:hypothetical protein